jgi:hypothetical protein
MSYGVGWDGVLEGKRNHRTKRNKFAAKPNIGRGRKGAARFTGFLLEVKTGNAKREKPQVAQFWNKKSRGAPWIRDRAGFTDGTIPRERLRNHEGGEILSLKPTLIFVRP